MRRRWTGWVVLLAICWGVAAGMAAPASAVDRALAADVMTSLGITAIVEQAPAALDYALAAERRARGVASSQESSWRRSLASAFAARKLRDRLLDEVLGQVDSAQLRHASALLEQPLPRRMRYFETAMTQKGAPTNLREFLQRLPDAPAAERRQQIEAIERQLRYAELVATLQSYAARAVQLRAGPDPVATLGPIDEEITLRRRYLEPLLVDYLLYTWRYMTPAELTAYATLLGEPQLQAVLTAGRQALRTALADALPQAAAAPGNPR